MPEYEFELTKKGWARVTAPSAAAARRAVERGEFYGIRSLPWSPKVSSGQEVKRDA